MKILDAGCGSGNLLRLLKEKISLDNNLYGLDYNKNINQINLSFTKLIRGDLRNLPFKEEVFDIIFCLDVFEHINEVNKAIDEVKRILKKEGYIIVCQPIEGLIYKTVKFLLKGQISNIQYWKRKIIGIHYYKAKHIKKIIKEKFIILKERKIPKFSLIKFSVIWLLRKKDET
jgi:ubiquinone/menaquinone biosynthesis C-methylase UbiE